MTPRRQGASPGSTVVLRCSHTSENQDSAIEWFGEDGESIKTNGKFEIGGSRGEQLRINSAEVSDSGVYVCRVQAPEGVLEGRGEVLVGK